jgi:hypothetical protein
MASQQNPQQSAQNAAQFSKAQFEELRILSKKLGDEITETFEQFTRRMPTDKALKDLRSMRKEVNDMQTDFGGAAKIFKDAVKEFKKGDEYIRDSVKAMKQLTDVAEDLRNDQSGITELHAKDLSKMIEKIQKQQVQLQLANKFGKLSQAQKRENENTLRYSSAILKGAQDRLALEQHITNQMGVTGAAVKGLSTVLDKLGVGGFLEIEDINEKMREVAKEGGSKMKVLGAGMKESFKSAGLAMRDIVTMTTLAFVGLKKLFTLSLEYEDKQFEVAKAMGVSVSEGEEMLGNFNKMAWANSSMALTAKQLSETYGQMNDTLGFMGPQNAEFLTTTAGIQRRLGLSAESMQVLQFGALKAGKTLTKTYSDVVGTSKAIGASLKLNMSEKQVVEAISKVSTTVLNNFKGNVKQLTAAVMTATKFGTTLDTINAQGNSLLDFESSISKEFEAQLLTGKDLNLSKARELALNHDTDGLMKELNSKMMTSNEYNKMNVLQQQAFAEAVGLSKEQMDEMYHKQEMVKLLGDDAGKSLQTQYETLVKKGYTYDKIAATLGDQAAQDAKRATAQEQMQATMERMADSVGQMTHFLADAANWFANIFSNADNIKIALEVGAAIMAGMVTYSLIISAKKREEANLQKQIMLMNHKVLTSQVAQLEAEAAVVAEKTTEIGVNETNLGIQAEKTGTEIVAAGASGFQLGPIAGAILSTAIIGGLMALWSSFGGSSKSASMPSMPTPSAPIEPTNFAAESVKASGPQKLENTGKSMSRGGNPNIYITVDPINGKKTVTTMSDYSAKTDSSKLQPIP